MHEKLTATGCEVPLQSKAKVALQPKTKAASLPDPSASLGEGQGSGDEEITCPDVPRPADARLQRNARSAKANPSRHSPIGTTAFHRGSFRPSDTLPRDRALKYDSKNKAYGLENF